MSVNSPCTRLCTLDRDDVCVGCGRTVDEICRWVNAGDDDRREILRAAVARKKKKGLLRRP